MADADKTPSLDSFRVLVAAHRHRAGSCGGYPPVTWNPLWREGMNDYLDDVSDPFELDVQIVTEGPATAALLSSTDDGCDTVKGSDC